MKRYEFIQRTLIKLEERKTEMKLREALADLCHKQWSGWMEHLFRFGTFNADGTFTMDADKVARWKQQSETPYAKLSDDEQDSDRKEADRFLAILSAKGEV